ncbi:ACRC (predicted) [Pycnogonum litorale]
MDKFKYLFEDDVPQTPQKCLEREIILVSDSDVSSTSDDVDELRKTNGKEYLSSDDDGVDDSEKSNIEQEENRHIFTELKCGNESSHSDTESVVTYDCDVFHDSECNNSEDKLQRQVNTAKFKASPNRISRDTNLKKNESILIDSDYSDIEEPYDIHRDKNNLTDDQTRNKSELLETKNLNVKNNCSTEHLSDSDKENENICKSEKKGYKDVFSYETVVKKLSFSSVSSVMRKQSASELKKLCEDDSDSDGEFEAFLTKMKIKNKNKLLVLSDADDFIDDTSLDGDDQAFHLALLRKQEVFDTLPSTSVGVECGTFSHKLSIHSRDTESNGVLEGLEAPAPSVFSTPDTTPDILIKKSDNVPVSHDKYFKEHTPKHNKMTDDSLDDEVFTTAVKPRKRKENRTEVSEKFCSSGDNLTDCANFLSSLSPIVSRDRQHPDARKYTKRFKSGREELSKRIYKIFNEHVFDEKLAEDMEIIWKPRLTKTAGRCCSKTDSSAPNGRIAKIELSSKVIDSPHRLRDVLLHEMCHAACWIVYGYTDGHGPMWKYWAQKAVRVFPKLPKPTVCHRYEISTKYTYKCVKCGYSIGRHSKSLDTNQNICGKCQGKFELLVNTGSTPRTPRTPSRFAVFVKENYGTIKKSNHKAKHGDVMRLLGAEFSSKMKV